MPAPSATYTTHDTDDYDAGDILTAALVLEIIQNQEWFGTTHDHSGDTGDGGQLTSINLNYQVFYMWQGDA